MPYSLRSPDISPKPPVLAVVSDFVAQGMDARTDHHSATGKTGFVLHPDREQGVLL